MSLNCRNCGKCAAEGKHLKKCARCLLPRYCSEECQVEDWKNGHKDFCEPLSEAHSANPGLYKLPATEGEAAPSASGSAAGSGSAGIWVSRFNLDRLSASPSDAPPPLQSGTALHPQGQLVRKPLSKARSANPGLYSPTDPEARRTQEASGPEPVVLPASGSAGLWVRRWNVDRL